MRTFDVIDAPQLREMFALDGGQVIWLAPPKEHARLVGRAAGSLMPNQSGKQYWAVQIRGRKVRRSHIVFCLTHGRWPTDQIDHINGDSLDDRPENLREATQTQNAWNHKRRAKRSDLPMGVRMAKSGRYVARIAVNGAKLTLGTYDTAEQARGAYHAARVQHFGEFA